MKLLKILEILWKCECRGCHYWELRKDMYLKGMPFSKGVFFRNSGYTRICIFRCKRCNKVKRFRRWAFIGGSGALHYFFDKYWSLSDEAIRGFRKR